MEQEKLFKQTLISFEKAENENWNLDQLVQYILKNHVITSYDNCMTYFVEHQVLFLGYLKLEFILYTDSEPLEVETYYTLYFKLSLLDEKEKETKVLRDDAIFERDYYLIFHIPEMDEEIPGLEETIQLTIHQTLATLNLQKKGNLLSYIHDHFSQDLSVIQALEFDGLLLYLSLHSKKLALNPCNEIDLYQIDKNMGRPLPQFYKRFLRVVGLENKLHEDLISNVEGFKYSDEEFIFSMDDTGYALILDFNDNPNQLICSQETIDNFYGDSPYSIFKTFREYVVEMVQEVIEK